jgi:hypothetical protein
MRADFLIDGGVRITLDRSHAGAVAVFPVTKGIRLLGITLSSLGEKQLKSKPPS